MIGVPVFTAVAHKTTFHVVFLSQYIFQRWEKTGKSVPAPARRSESARRVPRAASGGGPAPATRRRRPGARSPRSTGTCRRQGLSTSPPCSTRACRPRDKSPPPCSPTPPRSAFSPLTSCISTTGTSGDLCWKYSVFGIRNPHTGTVHDFSRYLSVFV